MVVLTAVFIFYFLLLVALLVGWKLAMRKEETHLKGREQLISVIIPVRNEAHNIGNLLNDLILQEFRKFEIIVVNDHSEDETLSALGKFDISNLKVLNNQGNGKKAAISTAIKAAKGPLIVTTDADCSVSAGWLTRIHEQFRDKKVMMAFGGVRLRGNRDFFSSLQQIEFASLIGSGAATAALGLPTMCNGANLAFRKKVFLEVKGYQDNLTIASGDDEFLMRKINDRYPKSIHFMNHQEAMVTTQTAPSLKAFVHQRIRWASKWRFNASLLTKSLAVFVVLIQLSFLLNLVLIFTPFLLSSVFILVLKMILEATFLLQICRFTFTRWNWLSFFALQLFYPLYVITVAAGSFFLPFNWKNRIFKP